MRRFGAAVFAVMAICLLIAEKPVRAMAAGTYAAYSGSLALAASESDTEVDVAQLTGAALPLDEAVAREKLPSYMAMGYTKTDLKYMAAIIYSEANSMSYEAMAAVGNVVLNRLYDNKRWASVTTLRQVIYQDGQFTPTKKPSKGPSLMGKALRICRTMDASRYKEWQLTAMAECVKVAKDVLSGVKVVPDSFCYFNADIEKYTELCLTNEWPFVIYGGHIYYDRNGK